MEREAFILEGLVSEEATKAKAQRRFNDTGEVTKIHYHVANARECVPRCTKWPPPVAQSVQ